MKPQLFLPLITYPEANSDEVAANATAVAAWLDADLNATTFELDTRRGRDNWLRLLYVDLPELIDEAARASRENGERLSRLMREQAGNRGVSLAVSTAAQPLLTDAIAEHARYFDLSLLGWDAGNPAARAAAQALVFGSGRPVMLLPAACQVKAIAHVAIAWDGSRVAARAVGDALPFLQRAARTSVFTVVDDKAIEEQGSAERLVDSLGRRGIAAQAFGPRRGSSTIGAALQEHALERKADLLVMGGFGHSVVRDFVLGGATENILDELRLPTLVSH